MGKREGRQHVFLMGEEITHAKSRSFIHSRMHMHTHTHTHSLYLSISPPFSLSASPLAFQAYPLRISAGRWDCRVPPGDSLSADLESYPIILRIIRTMEGLKMPSFQL